MFKLLFKYTFIFYLVMFSISLGQHGVPDQVSWYTIVQGLLLYTTIHSLVLTCILYTVIRLIGHFRGLSPDAKVEKDYSPESMVDHLIGLPSSALEQPSETYSTLNGRKWPHEATILGQRYEFDGVVRPHLCLECVVIDGMAVYRKKAPLEIS